MKTSPKLLSFVLLLVCAGLLSPGLHAAGKVKLGLHLQKGSSYNVRMVTDQKITSKFGDKDMEMIQNIALGYTFAVQDVDGEGNASIQTTYATVKAHLEGPMGTSDYDSAQPSEVESPVGKVLAAAGARALSVEGYAQGTWILMDYGDFLLHIFQEERREYYALERLWGDAPEVTELLRIAAS